MTVKVIAQASGGYRFLVDAGDGEDKARVYDRQKRVLFNPFNRISILARGGWAEPELDAAAMADLVAEIEPLADPSVVTAREIDRLVSEKGLTREQAEAVVNEPLDIVIGLDGQPTLPSLDEPVVLPEP